MNTFLFSKKRQWLLVACFSFIFANTAFSFPRYNITDFEPTKSHFDLVNGMILVETYFEGTIAYFILDTGSPVVILNQQTENIQNYQALSFQGNIAGEWIKISEISLAGVRKFNLNAMSMDLSHLEGIAERPIQGIIGHNFFEEYNLILDLEEKYVSVVPHKFFKAPEDWKLVVEMPFILEGHLPVIKAKLGKSEVRLGLDTGSGKNIIDLKITDELNQESLSYTENINVTGLSQLPESMGSVKIPITKIGGDNYEQMSYLICDLASFGKIKERNVDGLLGIPFFKYGKFTINYKSKRIQIWQ